MSVRNFKAVRKTAYIFLQTELKINARFEKACREKNDELDRQFAAGELTERQYKSKKEAYAPSLEYTDAFQRAEAAEKFFREILKIENVYIHTNLTKDQILTKLDVVLHEADRFDRENKDPQAVNAVFINWIGFCLREGNPFLQNWWNKEKYSSKYF